MKKNNMKTNFEIKNTENTESINSRIKEIINSGEEVGVIIAGITEMNITHYISINLPEPEKRNSIFGNTYNLISSAYHTLTGSDFNEKCSKEFEDIFNDIYEECSKKQGRIKKAE